MFVYRYFKVFSIFVLSVLAIFFVINIIPIQDLNPGAARILNKAKPKVAVKNNVYFSLLGLFSKSDDLESEGLKIYKSFNTEPTGNRVIDISYTSLNSECFNDLVNGCWDYIADNKQKISASVKENDRLLNRYASLHDKHTFFQEDSELDMKNIDWTKGFMEIHKLFVFSLLIDKSERNLQKAKNIILKDIVLWRSVLSNSSSMITKVIATAIVNKDINALTNILMSCQPCNKVAMPSNLSDQELGFDEIVENEFIFTMKLIDEDSNKDNSTNKLANFISNRDAINNSMYDMHQDFGRALSYNKLDINVYASSIFEKYSSDGLSWWLSLFYNPVGKIYAAIALPAYSGYKQFLLQLDFSVSNLRNINKIMLDSMPTTDKIRRTNLIRMLTDSIFKEINKYEEGDKATSAKISSYLSELSDITNDNVYTEKAIYWKSL